MADRPVEDGYEPLVVLLHGLLKALSQGRGWSGVGDMRFHSQFPRRKSSVLRALARAHVHPQSVSGHHPPVLPVPAQHLLPFLRRKGGAW